MPKYKIVVTTAYIEAKDATDAEYQFMSKLETGDVSIVMYNPNLTILEKCKDCGYYLETIPCKYCEEEAMDDIWRG